MEKSAEKQEIVLINEETIQDRIYMIRGQKVMLDFELAEIYGYTTKRFNEQGIYMLMTVLKGELAIQQSKALVRTFKLMKDYIIENQSLISEREYLQLSMKISDNIFKTMTLQLDLNKIEEYQYKDAGAFD